ncbi:MAG: ABC transporter substrate-binding protein [Oscillospiraceae bacterium]
MKRFTTLVLALALTLSLAACGAKPADPAPAADPAADKPFQIGIIQLAEHPALDAAREGFLAGLTEAGLVENTDYTVDVQNAQGEQAVCATIATKFVNDKVDLILAIATPAAQAAAQATSTIPILVTAVTDPASSGLVKDNNMPGCNVSGTSDMNPVKEQAALLQKLVPTAKNVGIMYCSSEDNSILQAKMARTELEALGLTVTDFTAADSSEVQAVAQSVIGKVDAIYMPTDNLMANTISATAAILTPAGVPIICGESAVVDGGATATFGISYEQIGRQTGAMAVDILAKGANIAEMPIQYCSGEMALALNDAAIAQLGLTVPADLK